MKKLQVLLAVTVLTTMAAGCGWRNRMGAPCGCAPGGAGVPAGVEAPYYAAPPQQYAPAQQYAPQQYAPNGGQFQPQNVSPMPGT